MPYTSTQKTSISCLVLNNSKSTELYNIEKHDQKLIENFLNV